MRTLQPRIRLENKCANETGQRLPTDRDVIGLCLAYESMLQRFKPASRRISRVAYDLERRGRGKKTGRKKGEKKPPEEARPNNLIFATSPQKVLKRDRAARVPVGNGPVAAHLGGGASRRSEDPLHALHVASGCLEEADGEPVEVDEDYGGRQGDWHKQVVVFRGVRRGAAAHEAPRGDRRSREARRAERDKERAAGFATRVAHAVLQVPLHEGDSRWTFHPPRVECVAPKVIVFTQTKKPRPLLCCHGTASPRTAAAPTERDELEPIRRRLFSRLTSTVSAGERRYRRESGGAGCDQRGTAPRKPNLI